MKLPKAPRWVFWALVVGLLVYEFWALATAPENVITHIVRALPDMAKFGLGFLMGHLVWGAKK